MNTGVIDLVNILGQLFEANIVSKFFNRQVLKNIRAKELKRRLKLVKKIKVRKIVRKRIFLKIMPFLKKVFLVGRFFHKKNFFVKALNYIDVSVFFSNFCFSILFLYKNLVILPVLFSLFDLNFISVSLLFFFVKTKSILISFITHLRRRLQTRFFVAKNTIVKNTISNYSIFFKNLKRSRVFLK